MECFSACQAHGRGKGMARNKVAEDPEYARLGGSIGAGMRRRLELGTPTPGDLAIIEKARNVSQWRKAGWTFAKIGEALGETPQNLMKFAQKGLYATALEWIARGKVSERALASPMEGRAFMGKLVPKALRRLELSLDEGIVTDARGMETLRESKAADNAMETVLDAAGLTGAEHVIQRPVIHIDQLVIQQLSRGIMEDDAIIEARQINGTASP